MHNSELTADVCEKSLVTKHNSVISLLMYVKSLVMTLAQLNDLSAESDVYTSTIWEICQTVVCMGSLVMSSVTCFQYALEILQEFIKKEHNIPNTLNGATPG